MNSAQIIFCFAAAAGIAAAAYMPYQNQVSGGGMARNTVPETVSACYLNQTAYNRFTRQPMHIENLIAIIRKIEQKTFNQWDMRRISRSILNRFQFDGLRYYPMNQQEYQFEASSEETAKTLLVKSMLPGDEALPDGLLDNDERCALHWMLSHSMNATMRDEELSSIRYGGGNLRARRWASNPETVDSTVEEEGEEHVDYHKKTDDEASESQEKPIEQEMEHKQQPEEAKQPSEEVKDQPEEAKQPSEEVKDQPEEAKEQSEEDKEQPEVAKQQSEEANEQSEEAKEQPEVAKQQSEETKEQSEEAQKPETKQQPEIVKETSQEVNKPEETKQQSETKEQSHESSENNEEISSQVSKESSGPQASNPDLKSEDGKVITTSLEETKESDEHSAEQSIPVAKVDDSLPKTEEAENEEVDTAAEVNSEKDLSKPDEIVPAPEQKPDDNSNDKKTSDEEVAPPPNPAPQSRGLNLPHDSEEEVEIMDGQNGDSKFAQQVVATKTKMPIETGVVYTKWGAVSAARVLAGIAAGLEPMSMTTSGYIAPSQGNSFGSGGRSPNNPTPDFGNGNTNNGNSNYGSRPRSQQTWSGRGKRQVPPSMSFVPLENVFAGTLSGDIGQAAILNAKSQITKGVRPPFGSFNNSICPREYVLEALNNPSYDIYNPQHSWSFMTEAEIRGGVDGLILGSKIRDWNMGNDVKLSDILEAYYSEQGVSGDPTFRSCDRSSLYNAVDPQKVREQARTFAWIYSNRTSKDFSNVEMNPTSFENLINDAYSAASSAIGNLRSDRQCTRRIVSGGSVETDDNLKFIEPRTAIYAVIDQTATRDEIWQQQMFLGQLAGEIGISPKGSRLGLVDGNSGQLLISPNFTDNSAVLSCAILGRDLPTRGDDKTRVLNAFKTEMARLSSVSRDQEFNIGEGNGITLLFFVQGKPMEVSQQSEIRRVTNEVAGEFGDVHVMYASSKFQKNEFQDYGVDIENDFIQIQGGNITAPTTVDNFLMEYNKRSHGRLFYPRCNANHYDQSQENTFGVDMFLTADSIRYYKISAEYFYSAKNLRLRFTSDNGKARICVARNERFPNSKNAGQNGVDCKETSGTYVPPGAANMDIEFGYSKPCGKHGKRSGCGPVYVSVTPTTQPLSTGGQVCSPDGICETTNKVKVTFTHWDMRCNSGIRTMISSPVALITVLTSLFMWFKST